MKVAELGGQDAFSLASKQVCVLGFIVCHDFQDGCGGGGERGGGNLYN